MVGLLVCNQEIGVRIPGGPMIRKVAGYGWPDRTANAVLLHRRSEFESLAFRLMIGLMVKWTSHPASTRAVQVRILVGPLFENV